MVGVVKWRIRWEEWKQEAREKEAAQCAPSAATNSKTAVMMEQIPPSSFHHPPVPKVDE
jgi:hypothetical protein